MPGEIEDDYLRFDGDGEDEVRKSLATGRYGQKRANHAKAWLAEVDQRRSELSEKDEISDRKEALRIARQSNYISLAAFLVAALALAFSVLYVPSQPASPIVPENPKAKD